MEIKSKETSSYLAEKLLSGQIKLKRKDSESHSYLASVEN